MGTNTKSKISRSLGVVVTSVMVVIGCAGKGLNKVGVVNDGGGVSGDADGAGKVGVDGAGTSGLAEDGKGGRTNPGVETGGKGGATPVATGGSSVEQPPIGGESGAGGASDHPSGCDACELVAEAADIRGVWAAKDAVYWIEYGGFDTLGNYQDDGRLLSLPFDQATPSVIATGLQGPIQLRVTDDFAYFVFERSSSPAGTVELARVSLNGGAAEALQALPSAFPTATSLANWFRSYFAASGGSVFWYNKDVLFELAENADGPRSLGENHSLTTLLADDSNLYLQDLNGITALALPEAAAATPILAPENLQDVSSLSLDGDFFYATQAAGEQYYFVRLPKAGGVFKRFAETQLIHYGARFVTDGSRYVGAAGNSVSTAAIIEGTFADPATHTLAIVPDNSQGMPWQAWDATPTAVYLGYRNALYRVARQF